MDNNLSVNIRYNGLDFTRAVLMITGIFFHTALIFKNDPDWRVSTLETNVLFNIFAYAVHSFRMAAFYIIAGFFFLMIYNKGRPGGFKERIFKLAIPLVFIGLTANSLINYCSQNFTFEGLESYIYTGSWIGHLWFISNLIVYYFISILLLKFNFLLKIKFNIFISMFLISIISGMLKILLPGNGKVFGFIFYNELIVYFPYYILGFYLLENKQLFFKIMNVKVLTTLCSFGIVFLFLAFVLKNNATNISLLLGMFASTTLSISSIIFLSMLGKNDSAFIRFISKSSYSVYLLHMPFIVITATLFYQIQGSEKVNIFLVFILLSVFTLFSLTAFYRYVISKSNILRLLIDGNISAIKRND